MSEILFHTQKILHGHGEENGDCFRAAMASVLRMSLDEVPHFMSRESERKHGGDYGRAINDWLRQYGLAMVTVPYGQWWVDACLKDSFHLMSGPSPRFPNEYHCVVGKGGHVFHDPHPDRKGLAPATDEMPWLVELIFPHRPTATDAREVAR